MWSQIIVGPKKKKNLDAKLNKEGNDFDLKEDALEQILENNDVKESDDDQEHTLFEFSNSVDDLMDIADLF